MNRMEDREPVQARRHSQKAVSGSVIVLVIIVVTITMLEVAMLSLILTRSLGDEGVLLTQNQTARRGAETALTRLSNTLYSYVSASGTTNVDTVFALGGTNDLDNVALTATDPEDGSSDSTGVVISAWLQERRGTYYHIVGQASYGDVRVSSHRWLTINPCTASGGSSTSSGISTILSPVQGDHWYIGRESTVVDSLTGTLFFSDSRNSQNGGPKNIYLWNSSTGLSTLVTGTVTSELRYGMDPTTGRFFFGDSKTTFYTWLASTGLSTLLTGPASSDPGYQSVAVFSQGSTPRVYWADTARVYSWQSTTGVSTVAHTLTNPGRRSINVDEVTGRVYFGDTTRFFTWHPSTGLSTLLTGGGYPGEMSLSVYSSASNPMVYFRRQRYNNSPFLMLWTPSRGLSTLFNSGWWQDTQGDVLVDRGGRLYALNDGYLNSYHPSTGISTLYTGGDAWDGCLSMDYTTGRVFFGSDHRIYSYLQSTGLSTLYTATGKNPGCHGGDITHLAGSPYKTWQENTKLVVDSTTGRIYFGTDAPSQTNGEFGSWHASTGVSIVGTTFMDPGSETSNGILVDTVRNRAVFGEGWNGSPSNARLYMWGPTNGFSTIMHSGIFGSDGYAMGPHALDIGTGRVFGNSTRSQWSGPYGMYVWYEGSSGSSGCD